MPEPVAPPLVEQRHYVGLYQVPLVVLEDGGEAADVLLDRRDHVLGEDLREVVEQAGVEVVVYALVRRPAVEVVEVHRVGHHEGVAEHRRPRDARGPGPAALEAELAHEVYEVERVLGADYRPDAGEVSVLPDLLVYLVAGALDAVERAVGVVDQAELPARREVVRRADDLVLPGVLLRPEVPDEPRPERRVRVGDEAVVLRDDELVHLAAALGDDAVEDLRLEVGEDGALYERE